MKTSVIIFGQGSRVLTDTKKQRSAEKTTVWTRRQNEAGHTLDPRILALDSAHRGPERDVSERGEAWPITALLFLEATDLGEAVQIAEAHPALRYSANVEVREWAPPTALPTGTRPAR